LRLPTTYLARQVSGRKDRRLQAREEPRRRSLLRPAGNGRTIRIGDMELDRNQASLLLTPTAPPEKPSIGALIFKIGLALYGVGVAAMVAYFSCALFLMSTRVPKPPLWLLGIAFIAVVLLPMGLGLSGIGALAWLSGRRKKS